MGISVLFVVIRMITLVSVAFIYVARVDVPFLSVHADEIGEFVVVIPELASCYHSF